jgi:hypothetical protein
MKTGDLVKNISARDKWGKIIGEIGLFVAMKNSGGYEYAEVMWSNKSASNGDRISTIQPNLIKAVK